MNIVLREDEWVEKMMSERSLGKNPVETLRRVARYYIDRGYSRKDVMKSVELFLLRCNPNASIPLWYDNMERAIKAAWKRPAVNIESITISRDEMDTINKVSGKQARRLAFTLLCLSKYWNIVRGKDDGWVNSDDNDIMRMANISTSLKRQSALYHDLRQAGLVEFSKQVDNTHVRVCFGDQGEPLAEISDFRNLGYRYLMMNGENFFECENCGLVTKIKSADGRIRKQKYCPKCANDIHIKQTVESTMRMRGKIAKNKNDCSIATA